MNLLFLLAFILGAAAQSWGSSVSITGPQTAGGNYADYDIDGAPVTFPYSRDDQLICYGGGYYFHSARFGFGQSLESLPASDDKDFKCEGKNSTKKLIDQYNLLRNRVHQLIDANSGKKESCSDITRLLQLFKNTEAAIDVHFKHREMARLAELERGLLKDKIQQDFSYRAWTSTQCAISHIVERNEAYWYLLNELMQRQGLGVRTLVTSNEEVIPDCSNVSAYGAKDLKSFEIDLSLATSNEILLSYDHYGIADHLKIYSGPQLLFDSTCKPMAAKEHEILNINPRVHPKITINIAHNCETSARGSAWEVHLSCQSNQAKPDPCADDVAALIKAIKEFLENTKGILENFARYSTCYELLHHDVNRKLFEVTTFRGILTRSAPDGRSRIPLSVDLAGLGDMQVGEAQLMSELAEREQNKLKEGIAKKGSLQKLGTSAQGTMAAAQTGEDQGDLIRPKGKSELTDIKGGESAQLGTSSDFQASDKSQASHNPTLLELYQLSLDRKNYCGKKKDHQETIFRYVTWAYCQHAYPRLFGIDFTGGVYE